MPTIIDLRPEIEKISGRIAIVALLILCLCIKVYTTQFWHDMNVYMNDEEIPYSHVYLLVCTKCGKFKQVKMKPG